MSDGLPEKKVVAHDSPPATERSDPEAELSPPTFRQALVGYGSIMLGLVLLGLLIGVLMRVLR
jgi:hypothetical protein